MSELGDRAQVAGRRPISPMTRRDPGPEELAAILAAVELAWPRPVTIVPAPPSGPDPWRFSGRWWSRPETARRERPWLPPPI